MEYLIDKMIPEDWDEVCRIYIKGIATGHSTFEADTPDREKWDKAHLLDCRLVARDRDALIGWAALDLVSGRQVYSGVAEVSLYVNTAKRHQGVGSALMAALISESEHSGIWTLQAGIFPENKASLALVKRYGFREVGRRERLGKMKHGPLAGVWRDVILVERRSRSVGTQ